MRSSEYRSMAKERRVSMSMWLPVLFCIAIITGSAQRVWNTHREITRSISVLWLKLLMKWVQVRSTIWNERKHDKYVEEKRRRYSSKVESRKERHLWWLLNYSSRVVNNASYRNDQYGTEISRMTTADYCLYMLCFSPDQSYMLYDYHGHVLITTPPHSGHGCSCWRSDGACTWDYSRIHLCRRVKVRERKTNEVIFSNSAT